MKEKQQMEIVQTFIDSLSCYVCTGVYRHVHAFVKTEKCEIKSMFKV